MINYMSVVDETWETSSLQKKLQRILLIAYQYDKELNPVDYLVRLVELWGIPEEDVPTFKKDWDTVVSKIRRGKAHELSGSDTLYLEAATKAANASKRTEQPYSSVPAKPRAWAIKPSYMTTALNGMVEAQAIRRDGKDRGLDLLSLVHRRFGTVHRPHGRRACTGVRLFVGGFAQAQESLRAHHEAHSGRGRRLSHRRV